MLEKNSYGVLGTIIWFLVIVFAFTIVQIIVAVVFLGLNQPPSSNLIAPEKLDVLMLEMELNGTFMAWATIATGVICTSLIFLAAKLCRTSSSVSAYLGLKLVKTSTYIRWGAFFVCLLVASEVMIYLTEKDSVPEVMIMIYQSASPKWAIWIAIIIAAPIFEEVFFRGFLFKGIANTFVGAVGAIVISSAIWALIHTQYELFYVGIIFIFGLFFGWVRHKTDSIYVPIFLHIMANLISTVQTHFVSS